MKKLLYLLGVLLAIGAVFTAVNNKKKEVCESEPSGKVAYENKKSVERKSLTTVNVASEEPIYEKTKGIATEKIQSRHERAATIMSASVETIHKNLKDTEADNDQIHAVSAKLNRMLDED